MTQADSVLSTPPTNTPVDTHDAAPFGKAAACSRSAFRKPLTRPRPYRRKEPSMRTTSPETSMNLIPPPGTTEALELGCTCQFIAHESDTQEREPAGMSIDPDPNCPLDGTNRDVRSTIFR